VLSQPDRRAGRNRTRTPPPVAVLARELGLPLLQPERALDALDDLRAVEPAAIAICAYGQLLPAELLALCPWLNLHPSALPRWRGAAPIERMLMAGDEETAVAIMATSLELDAGPVVAQERFPVGPDDDAAAVEAEAVRRGVPLLAAALAAPGDGVPQTGAATYAAKLERGDRLIDPAAHGVRETLDRVRALRPRVGALLALDGEAVTVWRMEPVDASLSPGEVAGLAVGLADGAVAITELQSPGRRVLAADEWLRGRRTPPGRAERPA
jgi:methionyl-tRNA formyltransferase